MLVMILVVTTQEVAMDNIVQSIVVQKVDVPLRPPSVPTIARRTNVWQVPVITEEVDMDFIVQNTLVLTQVVQVKNRYCLIIV